MWAPEPRVVVVRLGLDALPDPRLAGLVDHARAFYASRPARRGPSNLEQLVLARARAADPVPAEPPAVVRVVPGMNRRVVVRIHAPVGREVTGVLLQVPGGGFYVSSAASDDTRNRRVADALGVVVVSVDYRLAPEHPWPAAPDDCEVAALWLVAQAEQLFGTTTLAIGGFSAGATLAVTTMLRLRERGITAFSSAVLQFGTYDLSTHTPAGRLIADEYFLHAYAGHVSDRTNPDISPIFANLTGLPPTLLVVGAQDVLLEDNLAMAARLAAAGVDVDLRVYPAVPHGFTHHPTAMAKAATHDMDAWLAERLGPRTSGAR